MKEAVKTINKQKISSLTVSGLNELLKEVGIPKTLMGYDSRGNFSHSQVLYVIDGVNTEQNKILAKNEIEVFTALGLSS